MHVGDPEWEMLLVLEEMKTDNISELLIMFILDSPNYQLEPSG